MFKIIKKENINIEELKQLKDDGVRPILLGEFNDEEVKLYHSMGVYDIASTEEEAEALVKDPAEFKEVIDNNDIKYEEVERDVKIQRPGLFSKPVKVALASLAVFGITGATITALGSRNNVVKGEDVTLKSNETTDSKTTSVKFTVSDLIVLTEANEENAKIDISSLDTGSTELVKKYDTKPVEVNDVIAEITEETTKVKEGDTTKYVTSDGNVVATQNGDILTVENGKSYEGVSENATINVIDFDKVEDNTEVVEENTTTEDNKTVNEAINNPEPVQDEEINNNSNSVQDAAEKEKEKTDDLYKKYSDEEYKKALEMIIENANNVVIEFKNADKEQDTEIKDESTNSVQDAAAEEKARVDELAADYAEKRLQEISGKVIGDPSKAQFQ